MSSDKLLINLFGLIISADVIYAIVAAVIIVLVIAYCAAESAMNCATIKLCQLLESEQN